MKELFGVEGRVILITGASRGIGFAMAEALADYGAHVILNSRDETALREKVRVLTERGLKASYQVFDVTDPEAGKNAIQTIVGEFGGFYGLVNNAGIQFRSPILDFSDEDFELVIRTNLTSCFSLSREAIRLMQDNGGGRIVNTVSMLGPQARPTVPAYIAAKEGLRALTRALAVEVGASGILVNAIAPGYIETDMTAVLGDDIKKGVEQMVPLRRYGQPEEIASAVSFLASDDGGYVTGQVLVVDGGLTC